MEFTILNCNKEDINYSCGVCGVFGQIDANYIKLYKINKSELILMIKKKIQNTFIDSEISIIKKDIMLECNIYKIKFIT